MGGRPKLGDIPLESRNKETLRLGTVLPVLVFGPFSNSREDETIQGILNEHLLTYCCTIFTFNTALESHRES